MKIRKIILPTAAYLIIETYNREMSIMVSSENPLQSLQKHRDEMAERLNKEFSRLMDIDLAIAEMGKES